MKRKTGFIYKPCFSTFCTKFSFENCTSCLLTFGWKCGIMAGRSRGEPPNFWVVQTAQIFNAIRQIFCAFCTIPKCFHVKQTLVANPTKKTSRLFHVKLANCTKERRIFCAIFRLDFLCWMCYNINVVKRYRKEVDNNEQKTKVSDNRH